MANQTTGVGSALAAMQNNTTTAAAPADPAGKPKAAKLIPVRLNRDYWAGRDIIDQWPEDADKSGETCRFKAGAVINLPGKEARRLMDVEGVGVRADPLPDAED